MRLRYSFIIIVIVILVSCIGDDFIDNYVEPQLRITNTIDTLAAGSTYILEFEFFNNVGRVEESTIEWDSSDESVALVNELGEIWGRQKGVTTITGRLDYDGDVVINSFDLVVDSETVETPTERTGSLRTTSSYTLQGNFTLSESENGVILSIDESYVTDDVLPGLYIYLTNNPNSVADALVIQEVTVFEGAHSYEVEDVGLNDYSHVLYFCKPFNVKVGDGKFDE